MPHCRIQHPLARVGCLSVLAGLFSGCITVYQPLVSLQRPVAVDSQVANFEGTRLLVRCIPSDELPPPDAAVLCQNVSVLFRNQGAEVEMQVPREGSSSRAKDDAGAVDLVVDLRTRLLHEEDSTLLWVLYGVTMTLAPAITEQSFAQDVTIRDAGGSLLASDSLKARFVRYFGFGVWSVNWVADVLVRSEADEITGDGAKQDFSRDLYGQLSQLVFNAQVRSRVLRGFERPGPSGAN